MSLIDDAHANFMRRRANFIESNPGAVSPLERESTLGRRRQLEDQVRLNNHDLAMLRQQGINAIELEKQHGITLRDQGRGAAEVNLKGTLDTNRTNLKIAETTGANELTKLDRQILGQQEIARIDAQAKKDAAKIAGDATVDAADATGEWSVKLQEKKNEGVKSQVDATILAEERKHRNDMQLQALRNAGRQMNQQEMMMVLKLQKEKNIPYEQALQQVLALRGN